jgi:hypothetical protein
MVLGTTLLVYKYISASPDPLTEQNQHIQKQEEDKKLNPSIISISRFRTKNSEINKWREFGMVHALLLSVT